MEIEYLVVRKKDAESPVEIFAFPQVRILEAVNLFDNMQMNWTECYFCKVLRKSNLPMQAAFSEHISLKTENERLKQIIENPCGNCGAEHKCKSIGGVQYNSYICKGNRNFAISMNVDFEEETKKEAENE